MKALSLWQPWATLVIAGAKSIETRSWRTPFRGRLAIHAAKKWTPEQALLCLTEPFLETLDPEQKLVWNGRICPLPIGRLLGTVELIDCVRTDSLRLGLQLSDREAAFGDFRLGRWAWLLSQPLMLPSPVPLAGCMGLFDVDDALLKGP